MKCQGKDGTGEIDVAVIEIERAALPKPSIDTGAGLERILCLLQGVDSVWETDLMQPLIENACSLTGKTYVPGDYDDRDSFAMRVLAEHARSSAMLVSDGVFPSNEGRGYVLRRIIRRAVRYAYLLGTEKLVMPSLAETAIAVMGNAYPDVVKNRDFIVNVLAREEDTDLALRARTSCAKPKAAMAKVPKALAVRHSVFPLSFDAETRTLTLACARPNDIVAAEEEEAEEIFRILLELSDRFRARPGDFRVALAVAAPLMRAVQVFGFHLATVDLRQSSDKHEAVVAELFAKAPPSVNAASSSARPCSTITGISSRATKGKVTKVLASTMPGRAKMIFRSCSRSHSPIQPCRPNTSTKIRPAITGLTENGRSISVSSTLLPLNSNLAIAQAAARPKSRLSGTTSAAAGGYNFTAQARDANNCVSTQALSVRVVCPASRFSVNGSTLIPVRPCTL